jgi:hypothetical protein
MSQIEIANVGIEGIEHLFRGTIRDVLGEDKRFLRSLEVKPLIATCDEMARDLAKTKGILSVKGFLSLDGEKGRMLEFNMEMGLTRSEDMEIAEQLAFQCKACVEILQRNKNENK